MRPTVRQMTQTMAATLPGIAAALVSASGAAAAGDGPMWDGTVLSELRVSGNSQYVGDISTGATNLSDGSAIPFYDWYSPEAMPDLRVGFLTPVSRELGVLWGFGTGEAGDRYWIEPSLKLGVVARSEVTENSDLVFRLSTVVGGRLKERTCTADYGEIGGVQTVNCRLSATIMRPEDTLDHLFYRSPSDRVEMLLRYTYHF